MKQHYVEIIWFKAIAELRAEAARFYLGFLWWVFEPVLYMSAFYIVFGIIFERGGEDYVPFLLCGLVVWKWFGSTVIACSNSIAANSGLMQQVYLPKYIFPAIVVVTNSIKFLVVFALLLIFLIIYGYSPSVSWLSLPIIIILQLLLISAIGSMVASLIPFVPDFRLLLDNIIMLFFFLSGVFFDITNVAGDLQYILKLNPMAVLIESYRLVLIDGSWPDSGYLFVVFVASLAGLLLASRLLNRYDRIYPKVLL
jgi:lipopolysaccharide transport system permease protein